jgi:hypothetical protein
MKVFIDESGTFSWRRPQWSIIAAVGICELDETFDRMLPRFKAFERSLPPERREASGEIKGSSLTDQELATFVWDVLPRERALVHVSLTGFHPSAATRESVIEFRDQLSTVALEKERHRYASAQNRRMVQTVDEGASWIRRRSPEDICWLVALQTAINDALTHSVIALLGANDDGRSSPRSPTCSTALRESGANTKNTSGFSSSTPS